MRLRKMVLALVLAALPLALGGCGVLGPGPGVGGATPSASATPGSGGSWIVVATGSAPPSPSPSYGTGSPSPALPAVSFLPVAPGCAQTWTSMSDVLIPLTVNPGKGSVTVTWPRQYGSNYRIAAVKQSLVSGNQLAYTWQNVAAGTGCTVTTTISGLKSGAPYVIWLDAPGTGYERDGTRHLYSGKSGVIYPL
jgi:hypothetical protein